MLVNVEAFDLLLAAEQLQPHLAFILVLLRVLLLHLLDFVLLAASDTSRILTLPVFVGGRLLFVFALLLGLLSLFFRLALGRLLVELGLDVFGLLRVLRLFYGWVLPGAWGLSNLHNFDVFVVALHIRDDHCCLFLSAGVCRRRILTA